MSDLILPLEKQVSLLESAKRLRELGVRQESLFYYDCRNSNPFLVRCHKDSKYKPSFSKAYHYAAFTVAEILEILPREIEWKKDDGFMGFKCKGRLIIRPSLFVMGDKLGGFFPDYQEFGGATLTGTMRLGELFRHTNLAESCSKILRYLLENKLMEVPK